MSNLNFTKLNKLTPSALKLLLLGDESIDAIKKYIYKSEVFIVKIQQKEIGVFVLDFQNDIVEIKNIAITKEYQQKGIGKSCISFIEQICTQREVRKLIVGTGDASVFQLLFYQKCGFEVSEIKKNFFTENYTSPIFENNVQLKHMILLSKII